MTSLPSWLSSSPDDGQLFPGSTNVTLSVNAAANALPPGTYNDSVLFSDCYNGGNTYSRSVRIVVTGGPMAYCTAKTSLVCGTPSISFSGTPQAGATSGFVISAAPARENKAGRILYSCAGPAGIPFMGGFLCVAGPIRRTPSVSSGGGAACTGVFQLDFNTFASGGGGGSPDPCLTIPGQPVWTQWWARDSIATGSFLSNGLAFNM